MSTLSLGATRRVRVAKRLASIGFVCAALLGAIGFAHTPAGRPMLMWLASTAGCPVDLSGGDAATVEAFRVRQGARKLGLTSERSRPALGFTLGATTREQAAAQLGGAAQCTWSRQRTVLKCVDSGLRVAHGTPIADLHLQFDTAGVLVAVDAFHAATAADLALAQLARRQQELDALVGAYTDRDGPMSAQELAQGNLRHTGIEYRYRNYVARISATNFGARGVRLREQYQWFANATGT